EIQYMAMSLKAVTNPLPKDWACGVSMDCTVHSQVPTLDYLIKTSKNPSAAFDAEHVSWEMTNVIPIEDLFLPANKYIFMDSINITFEVNLFPIQ
ncbi:hypothetical protein PFISCL1PPCAC_9733, partial [Pristionchus fissidentatus]